MPISGLVLRLVKGSPLSASEVDGNWTKIRDFCNSLEQLFGVVLKSNGTLKDGAVGSAAVIADGIITDAKLASSAKLPPGTMLAFGGTSVPSGFLECNGATVSRTTYAALFTAIGTAWGPGDGSTTFNLPDMRRRTFVGSGGTGSGTLNNAVGNTGGAESVTISEEQLPPHTHDIDFDTMNLDGGPNETADLRSPPSPTGARTVTTESTGDGDPVSILQPSAIVLMVIKT